MSKVFTANIILSTDKKAISRLFNGASKNPNVFDRIKDLGKDEYKSLFVVAPGKDSGLLDLDFSFAAGGNDGFKLDLTFIETDNSFEKYYLENSVNFRRFNKTLKEFISDESLSTEEKARLTKAFTGNPANYSYSLANERIYFTFGIGSNLKKWAGPFQLNLNGGNIEIDQSGNKLTKLTFYGVREFFHTNKIESEFDAESGVDRYSRILKLRESIVRAESKVTIKNSRENLYVGEDVHKIIVDLIKDYIFKITGSRNSIVILPNLNKEYRIFRSKIDGTKPIRTTSDIFRTLDEEAASSFSIFKAFFEEVFGLQVTKQKETGVPLRSQLISPEALKEALQNLDIEIALNASNNSTDNIATNTPDYFSPLRKIRQGFYLSMGKTILGLLEECDINIINLWHSYKWIDNSDDNVFIFCDEYSVRELLYCESIKSIDKTTISPSIVEDLLQSDITLYNNTSYRIDYFNRMKKFDSNSSFGEDVFATDELALTEIESKSSKILGIPIFRHNMPNSNVLAVMSNFNNSLLSVYSFGYRKRSAPDVVNLAMEQVRAEPINLSIHKLLKIVRDKSAKLVNLPLPGIINEIRKDLLEANDRDIVAVLAELKNDKEFGEIEIDKIILLMSVNIFAFLNPNKPFIEVDDELEAINLQQEISENLSRYSLNLGLKTVPFFKLSGMRCIGQSVLVKALKNKILGTTTKKRLQEFSGHYIINGFRHKISSSECYSEFNLVKSGYTDELSDSLKLKTMKELMGRYFPSGDWDATMFPKGVNSTEVDQDAQKIFQTEPPKWWEWWK